MRTRRSDTLGLIVPSIRNPFYPAIARGVEDVAREHGRSVLVTSADRDQTRRSTTSRCWWTSGWRFRFPGHRARGAARDRHAACGVGAAAGLVQAIERTAPGYTRYLMARVRETVIPNTLRLLDGT
jgi:hypothetical protein